MTADGFRSDHQRLAEHAGEFTGLASRAGDITGELRRALEQAGDCWGSDAVGRSFAASHVRAATETLGRVGGLSDGLGDVGQRFAATAETYRQVDEDNAAALRPNEG
ncbi:hypothetical protein F0L68_38195 [Solihabitans fulvus]|uniref:WXG100 family type VII secretion target n=1 Tax=Solihabitans fulvus TaxID=1892852 RepID=A0A5B2WKG2_9PSEU|nr:hypothetical protein [Solihabitans fulvus]KAA2251250.1 hypothetical protein F0L68_38195 [Solihabitans fulvus]